ncbi:integrator complex assembly factor BRAT1 [Odontesthes bonariensis]|uniref:integrator complex assembly factor BRAT1 n=1 Tax=Odontesthes bonariensis TaxID=219752 RepID=UPI003F58892B
MLQSSKTVFVHAGMDRDCVSVLPRVCEVLAASGSSLPDDTSLEKLLDWFTTLTKTGVSLVEACPCLLEFISTVGNDPSPDPSVLSFALKLTGLMGATVDGFKVLQESSVLDLVFDPQRWQEAGLWEDPCTRIGWIQGLRTMLQHSTALSFFVQADFIDPLLHLQTDSSLFVAAAANQTLAHVLLSCQNVPSVGFNGEVEVNTRTDPSIADLERPTAASETDKDRSAVVVTISEYLKKSLVPKEASRLHQSRQILKLLALLLSQAGPPLRDKLLLTVADSLEELVTTNHSQLTPPLMDVLLAARSGCGGDVPVQRVSHLLSFMLNTRKPADLIHAAAAVLRRGHDDRVLLAQSARVLLLPLDIATGLNLLSTNASADEHRPSMVEQLKIKTSCVSMVCVSVTSTPQISLMAPDCRPCPPALIVTAVLSLLRLSGGDTASSSPACVDVFRNVAGCGKVQKCALEALSALSSCPEVEVTLVQVFTHLTRCLENPDSDPSVLQKSYQALVKWISVCTDLSSITEQLRQDLTQVVRKRACDVRWEVRDSTVEFLGHLAGVRAHPTSAERPCDASGVLLGGCRFTTPLLKEALRDQESYVRASSISALAQTLTHSWHQGAALTQEQTEIVTRLLEILSQDTEGFARRAVVRFFILWFSSSSSCCLLARSVPSVLSQGSADLDWEVKVHTLELAELLLDRAFSGRRGYAKGSETPPYAVTSDQTFTDSDFVDVLDGLVEQGVVSALLSGLVDCDRPVGLKACRLLIRLRDAVCPLSSGPPDATVAPATNTGAFFELPGWGWAQEIRRILGENNQAEAVAAARRGVADSEGGGEAAAGGGLSAGGRTVRVGVREVLRSLGLDEKLGILAKSSDHIHNSPLSLLQDILTASSPAPHSQPGQEVIVDCY